MTSNWEVVRLADVAMINPPTSKLTPESPFITMSDVDEWGRWASTSGAKGSRGGIRAEGGDVLVARITPCLENGKIAMVPRDLGAVGGSTEFIVLRGGEKSLSEFLFLWASESGTHASAINLMVGSTGRQRVSASDFAALPMSLPSIAEQRRIVDLIGALDEAIEAAQQVADECAQSWASAILSELSLVDSDPVKAESMFRHVIGGSWGSPPSEEDTRVQAIGPSSYAGSRIDVDLTLSTERSLSAKRAKVRSLEPGDIVLERSGGSPTQPVGRVIRMSSTETNVVPSDFMRLLRPDPEVVDSALAFWIMWALYRSDASLPYQKFTTGIRNLNIPDYLSGVSVRIPRVAGEQVRIVEMAESFLEAHEAAKGHTESLRALRSEMLTSLLSGSHTIPDSYDALLKAVDA
ncbi:restriction endonuclease subunit S [Paeniglutamicibacter sp.]|uniref:restriction endonuclease subunit S n=1 Tax=Paeniglutamicibacter sp. TaxID=1934391 RepID=UPI003989ADD3